MKKIYFLLFLSITLQLTAQTTPGKHLVKLENINTKQADFGVNFMGKNQIVFASPNEKVTIVKKVWRENGQPYLDLYVGDIDSTGAIVNKRKLEGAINKRLHEASVAFTKDLKTVYFSGNNYNEKEKSIRGKEGYDNVQLYRATLNSEGMWGTIEKLPFNSDDFSTGLPSLSSDEKKLYFASNRPGGFGKTDLYVVDVKADGSFGEPKNLGDKINTEEREMFPFIADDNILYFSSTGHPGYGGLDVFAVKIFDSTVSPVLNLEQPINSIKDDFAYIINDEAQKGFVSSNREGKGDDDIYSFIEEEKLFIECLQEVKGIVRDENTKEAIPGAIVQLLDKDGKQLQITAAHEDDGTYIFKVPCGKEYAIVATNDGYLKKKIEFSTVNDLDQPALEQNLDMTPDFIIVGDELLVNINVIYFDFNKYNIRPDAATELDKVVEVMKKYPELDIHAISHTDERGTASYNMRLSKKRAKSTVDYLIAKGIDPNRVTSEGKGESQPAVNCKAKQCTEEEHQLNRRTNFKVKEQIKIRQENKE